MFISPTPCHARSPNTTSGRENRKSSVAHIPVKIWPDFLNRLPSVRWKWRHHYRCVQVSDPLIDISDPIRNNDRCEANQRPSTSCTSPIDWESPTYWWRIRSLSERQHCGSPRADYSSYSVNKGHTGRVNLMGSPTVNAVNLIKGQLCCEDLSDD